MIHVGEYYIWGLLSCRWALLWGFHFCLRQDGGCSYGFSDPPYTTLAGGGAVVVYGVNPKPYCRSCCRVSSHNVDSPPTFQLESKTGLGLRWPFLGGHFLARAVIIQKGTPQVVRVPT